MRLFLIFVLFFSFAARAEEKKAVPYLGPGADKLSAADYERVYKNYIQTSILLDYPFFKEKASPCDQALRSIFRGAGMFSYPVPADAQQVQRSTKNRVETYELAGVIVQVARNKSNGLEKLVLVNSASPKATRRLSGFAKKELLVLDRDPVTGLERVHGIPVGYPHPFLTSDGQGLYVKVLKFNGKTEGCEPLDFQDNAWVGGFDLSESRCSELQQDAQKVWNEQLSPEDFSDHELQRMKEQALKAALAKGTKESEAKALVEKHFTRPLTSEINVVGSAMRNLAQCNLLALGKAGKGKTSAKGGESSPTEDAQGGSGSAK
ncbi:MAG TPA: hypothetical protein VIH99_14425 [Bdellovibrionota bacterium]|jgi:hypothetical protein